MTVSPPLPRQRDSSGELGDVEEQTCCAVCDHQVADHDAIGRRYCQATAAQAHTRKCICRDV